MEDYCWDCKYRKKCDLADNINFCEDCKDYYTCDICYSECKAGYSVECNNGFEPKNDYDDYNGDDSEFYERSFTKY